MPSSDAAFGRKWLELLPAEVRADGQRALTRARTGKTARFAGKSVLPGRKPQYWDNILTPVLDAEGAVETILCVSRDVTVQRLAQHRLRVASEHDPLTDLLNRRSLKSRMTRAVTRGRQNGSRVGLLLIDLDHFKNVNDTLGHGAGDHLLRVLSRRLKARLPEAATVGRLGGDEFAVLLEDVEPHYQPKVRLEDGSIIGFEALLRWRAPDGQLCLPGAVVEAFKDYELAAGLACLMQDGVMADMARWREMGLPLLPVSINAAPVEFLRDDFGTGHSSFAHLRDYPVDNVKIDRSFVSRMIGEPTILAIVEAISRLGPALSIDVIAEGIETERQREILLSAECRFGQGFLFGKAMSAADAARRLVDLPATGWSPGGPPMQVGRGALQAQAPVAGAGLSAPTPNG